MELYKGKITTTGSSRAIRLDMPLFTAHPEFEVKDEVLAQVIAPGTILISTVKRTDNHLHENEKEDLVMGAFLAFLGKDIVACPQHVSAITKNDVEELESITNGVQVNDAEEFPEGIL